MQNAATFISIQKHETVEEAAKALEKSISDFFDSCQPGTSEEQSSDADDLSGLGICCA